MTKKGVDCFGTSCLAMTDYFTHPLNPPPQGRGRILDLPSANKSQILRILYCLIRFCVSRKIRRI
ncbi:hypothetical protein ACWIUD_01460 [Helicobacter sp. 23-1044]